MLKYYSYYFYRYSCVDINNLCKLLPDINSLPILLMMYLYFTFEVRRVLEGDLDSFS